MTEQPQTVESCHVSVRQVKVQARQGVKTHIVILDLTNDLFNIDGVSYNYNCLDGTCPMSQTEYEHYLKTLAKEDEVLLVTVEAQP